MLNYAANHEITAELQNGAVTEFDQRGLMPLDKARKLVATIVSFRRGKAQMINGKIYWQSDIAWAAILSLENAEEFLQEAYRIQWYFHPRGGRNTALLDRYGEGILPWLCASIRADGHFINVPWCIKECLLAIDDKKVFDFIWNIHSVTDGTEGFPGPFAADDPGDADLRINSRYASAAPPVPDEDADNFVCEWVRLHPETGIHCLRQLATAGNGRAIKLLAMLQ